MFSNVKRPSLATTLRATLGLALLGGVCAVYAASGFIVTPAQEKLITVGMTRDEVRSALGRPAHNVKYPTEPGRTWTWGLVSPNPTGTTPVKVFDVDFSADQKVLTFGERTEPDMK